MLEGGCFCGFVRYRADGNPTHETNCHCSICRRTSAAPFVTWFTIPAAEFAFTSGQPSELQSSDHGSRTFCPRCGTLLTFRSTRSPDEVDITTCS
ncbi:MAG: GFA family protein, partial [Gammaproteobacteria bacterium]